MTESLGFLDRVAVQLLADYQNNLSDVIVVLPNKRARLFLFEALQRHTDTTIFAPDVISIEDFVQDIAGIRSIDSIELLFNFYAVYQSITDKEKQQSFEVFSNWATTLIQDFNEIDRYLQSPTKVLSYLKDIEDLKHWSVDLEVRTSLIESHLQFWKLLPTYYDLFYSHLINKNVGYQGLIYREAVNNLEHFTKSIGDKVYLFAGFNALNAAEEKIIQHLLSTGKATILWDIDHVFLSDPFHDAGLFIRRFKENWSYYKNHEFKWIHQEFSKQKNIQIIGTPKSIGQAKIAGKIVEEHLKNFPSEGLNKVAIILAEESLLVPVLYSFPAAAAPLNITMGYSAKNNPAQILIAKLFRLHTAALARDASRYVMYYKDMVDVLTHPLIEPFVEAHELVRTIKANNLTFINYEKLQNLHPQPNSMCQLLFTKWDSGAPAVLDLISSLIIIIKNNLGSDSSEDKITKAFVYSIYKIINKLQNYYAEYSHIDNVETLYSIYKQVIDLAEVSFEGEPLNGLQVMGVLESRVLDFDTVIITSVNEGKFPAGKSTNSFIPYDVKRELGLPTFKEKDAIYTYHFYHLLQRAKNVYLLYNTESEGLDAGEKSRFITQLLVEQQPNHNITQLIYNPELPQSISTPITIHKSQAVLERLQAIAFKGFSPSALTSYIRNPIDFYYRKILGISETDEVEENIALNTLGTIIHEALFELLTPYIGQILNESHLQACRDRIDFEVLRQFRMVYKEGEITKGRNLLAFEVAKRNVFNFLKMESASLQNNEVVRILSLEQELSFIIDRPELPFPVKIGGKVDRIEERDGVIRIIDYKSGRVEPRDLVLKTWENLTLDIKNDKIIQILAYAQMLRADYPDHKIQAGIISFKNIKCGFMPFEFVEEKVRASILDDSIMEAFQKELIVLLNEILDPDIPFSEKV